MNTMDYVSGFFVGLVIAIVFAFLALSFVRKKWGYSKSEYDERQKQAIGKAYRDGFWTLLFSMVVMLVLIDKGIATGYEIVICDFVCFLGLAVYIVSCILRDAYIGINDNAGRWITIMIVVGLINVAGAIGNMKECFWNGWMNLLCAALVFLIVTVYGIKALIEKYSSATEE